MLTSINPCKSSYSYKSGEQYDDHILADFMDLFMSYMFCYSQRHNHTQ